jgi:hypothetical protein
MELTRSVQRNLTGLAGLFGLVCASTHCGPAGGYADLGSESQAAFSNDCQSTADQFGIVANSSWGFAPDYVQNWWTTHSCFQSADTLATCAGISARYGVTANQTWGYAPADVQSWWTSHGCNTTSRLTACQVASNTYGIDAGVTFGFAPAFVQSFWTANGCNTHPQLAACSAAAYDYGICAKVTFGFAPDHVTPTSIDVQSWWKQNHCDTCASIPPK